MNTIQSLNHSLRMDLNIIIDSPIENIWKLLISPESIKEYFYGTNTISDWTLGSEIRFVGEWEGKPYEDKGKILVFDECKEFTYSYFSSFSTLPDLPENYARIEMKLKREDTKSVLCVTQIGFLSMEQLKHSEENWNQILETIKQLATKGITNL